MLPQFETRSGRRLGCHGTLYVPNARGWYAYPVRTVRGALGASRPVRPVRTQHGRLVRVARTYPTKAPEHTCQLRIAQVEQRVGREGEQHVRALEGREDLASSDLGLGLELGRGLGLGLGLGLGPV